MSYSSDFQIALEILSARLHYLLEHRRLSETWEQELDALTMAIESMQRWKQEYESSPTPQFIDEFIANHQYHLRLENRFTSNQF